MLYGHRKRQRAYAEAEARGESLWTPAFSDVARTRLRALFEAAWPEMSRYSDPANEISQLLRHHLGVDVDWNHHGLVDQAMKKCSDELMPSLIEAIVVISEKHLMSETYEMLNEVINIVLAEERISYELVNGQMVDFESKQLHQEVVAPTLRLLSGRPGWDKVEAAYQDALREIAQGHAADAITDVGTALQEALALLGCKGNALGPLVTSARKKGLLGAHDSKLTDGVEKMLDWVSADRSILGDSHKGASEAVREDAWLAVHVVGALILRLAGGARPS